ncbi:RNA polymerase sigma factor [Actinomadura nitritigenes]|uniref:RNA polymerase sigma factor n=1 Tax=Actinomadura nitritigenes TaxID=134602 RepID=UPI003D9181CA
MVFPDPPTDEELTLRAQAGESGALGLLLARHQAPMRAVALSLLGYGPDAEDAMQDAFVTALRRIGDVRDPAAVGAWLRAVVRNAARMRLRAVRETPGLDGLDHLHLPDPATCPDKAIERHAMRDWIWSAVEQLPAQLQLVLMLRHFTDITSYQQIATACGVPVGTVRSRLNQARGKLAEALLSTAEEAHDDASALTEDSRQEAVATLQASRLGRRLPQEIAELWPEEAELLGVLAEPGERSHPIPAMRQNLDKGVRQDLRHVVASRDVTIWEMDVTNPADVADPCPSTLAWLMFRKDRKVRTLRVVFPEPPR